MKKVVSFLALMLAMVLLFGCTKGVNNNKAVEPYELSYSYSVVACVDNQIAEVSDGMYILHSLKELESFKTENEEWFDFSKSTIGETSATLDEKLSVYNDAFFKEKVLVVVRRNFVTDNVLYLNTCTTDGNVATMDAKFMEEGDYEESVRFFFIQFDKEEFGKIKDFQLNVSTVETTTDVSEVALLISKGADNYKTVYAPHQIVAIEEAVRSFNYEKGEAEGIENYNPSATDVLLMYQGNSAIFADNFIYMNEEFYKPNAEAKNKLISMYDALEIPEENGEELSEEPTASAK